MLANAKRIVIKVGSSLLIDEANHVRREWLATLAADIAELRRKNIEVIVVTSGAVALGRHPLKYGTRALALEEKQAAAACGQITLIAMWAQALEATDGWLYPAQILLTADDSINRRRYLNARSTLEALLENGRVIPVINENDTVATAELRVGDNDRLSARVAQIAGADILVLFSDIDGLYTSDPRHNKDAKHKAEVHEITLEVEFMAGGTASNVGTGGMITKLAAAKIAMAAGCHTIIASGIGNHPIRHLMEGGRHTKFIASDTPHNARKRWIDGIIAAGTVTIDDGAKNALKSGKSLLPAGVVSVKGTFDSGDMVLICDNNGDILGKGIISYAAEDAVRILGKKSHEIEQILGFKRRDVLIHRDDMVLE